MNDYLTSKNFSQKCNVIFAKNVYLEDKVTYKVSEYFELEDNDIIFCKTDAILFLFDILKNEKELKNIKLITHESDYEINQKLFSLKPSCISKWYAQNVNYVQEDLIPIPIGLSDDYYSYYALTSSYFENKTKNTVENTAKKLLYINHRIETFPENRKWIYEYFQTNDWCTTDTPNLSLKEYTEKLNHHQFILCPRGNGIDTHRLWESLYNGIIPIVEQHIHYQCLENLPVIIVDSFKQINKNFLEIKLFELSNKKFNMEKLKTSWWINKIKSNG
jgi:hypothetical protein